MEVQTLYRTIEKLSECVKSELDKGVECVDTCEMGAVADIIKDLSESMYHIVLTESMVAAGSDETVSMFNRYRMTPERYRDMDIAQGRMYSKDDREGASGTSRRMYMESKELHKSNSVDDKQAKMRSLETYMKDLAQDITGMIAGATAEEKTLLKSKMQALIQTI